MPDYYDEDLYPKAVYPKIDQEERNCPCSEIQNIPYYYPYYNNYMIRSLPPYYYGKKNPRY